MMDVRSGCLENARREAARLLEAVLDERLSGAMALVHWPADPQAQTDPSLQSAYQALWHFEADEAQQKTEAFYLDAQLELLKQMGRYLVRGEALPPYLCGSYPQQHSVRFYDEARLWSEPFGRWWGHVWTWLGQLRFLMR